MSTHSHPLILGHRGASASAPDNTLSAYALAVAQDADGIELDVRRTADDAMVLHHDAAADGVGPFVDLTLAEIREKAPDVVTLDEMLAVTGDLLLDIEIKNHPIDPDFDAEHRVADWVVDWIQRHQLHARVIVSSFNWDTMSHVKTRDETIPTGQLIAGPGTLVDYVGGVGERGHLWILPPDAMFGTTAAEQISAAHDIGLRVMVWTVDEPARMLELADAGIDGIITNDPGLANRVFAGR